MFGWILTTKVVKLIPHLFFIPYIAFAYHHIIKLHALFTSYDGTWKGRDLDKIDAAPDVNSVRSNEENGSNAGEDNTSEPPNENTRLLGERDKSEGLTKNSGGS